MDSGLIHIKTWSSVTCCSGGEIIGGKEATSEETLEIGWFAESTLPEISDGYLTRISFGFESLRKSHLKPHFEQGKFQ